MRKDYLFWTILYILIPDRHRRDKNIGIKMQ